MNILRTSLLSFAAALAAAGAHATTVATGQPAASQPAARAWATRDQLHACLDAEAGLKERARAIDASNAAHQKMFDETEAENARLQEAQDHLDHDSSMAVKRFNALVRDHNLHVQRLNQDAADSAPAANAYNDELAGYNRKCGGLQYHAEDLDVEMKDRKKAAGGL